MADVSKQTKYSYSRLAQYKNCPFAYDLKYNQQKYVDPPTLVTLLGTTIHHIEEKISLSLREGKSPNYSDLIDELYNINRPKISKYDTDGDIFGVKILQERFTEEYFTPSEKTGLNSYFLKKTTKRGKIFCLFFSSFLQEPIYKLVTDKV